MIEPSEEQKNTLNAAIPIIDGMPRVKAMRHLINEISSHHELPDDDLNALYNACATIEEAVDLLRRPHEADERVERMADQLLEVTYERRQILSTLGRHVSELEELRTYAHDLRSVVETLTNELAGAWWLSAAAAFHEGVRLLANAPLALAAPSQQSESEATDG